MTLRKNAPRATQRWGILWAVVATFTLVFGALVANAASLAGSNFEIDGAPNGANLKVDGASPAIDWLTGGTGTAMRTGVSSTPDQPTGSGDDSFGQGSKEDTAVPTVVSGSIPPNKSDLKNFGVYVESNANGDFLNLFWARVQDPSGTTNMDFEFNHNACVVGGTTNVCSANGVTPVRTPGDLLIQYDLSQGGTTATISKREWTGTAWGDAIPLGSNALGTINLVAIPASEAGGLGSLSPRTFGEASINLASLFTAGQCEAFGSAYLKSRSSDTFSSALKDFIAPAPVNVTNCGSITIIKDAVPNNAQDFAYTTSTNLTGFSLDDDAGATGASATLSNTKTFSGKSAGSYSVAESAASGWTLASITCDGPAANWAIDGTNSRQVNIALAAKQNITCTFVNNQDLANPSATSTPKVIPQDTVTVSGFDNTGSLDGTMTVSLYASGDTGCTGSPVYTDTFTLTSNGAKVTDNTGVAATDGYTITSSGIYRWKVDYAGDSRNNDFHIACGVELINVTLTGNTP
jgi:hypothetical protein